MICDRRMMHGGGGVFPQWTKHSLETRFSDRMPCIDSRIDVGQFLNIGV